MTGRGALKLATEEELELMIVDYLGHAGFERAATAMEGQLRERRSGKQLIWRPVGREMQEHVKHRMLEAINRGDCNEVLKLWHTFVPPLVRHTDLAAQKLEFYLNIYFAVYPIHPASPSPQPEALPQSMHAFKRYLETDGAALAATSEFLAYYAMPYVPEIGRHPSFKELFAIEWVAALKTRLADFLAATPQFASEPRLLTIYRSYHELDGNYHQANADGVEPAAAQPAPGATADGGKSAASTGKHGASSPGAGNWRPGAATGRHEATSPATAKPTATNGRTGGTHPVEQAAQELQALKVRLREVETRAAEGRHEAAAREAAMQRGSLDAVQLANELVGVVHERRNLSAAELCALEARLSDAHLRLGLNPPSTHFAGDEGGGGELEEDQDPLGGTMTVLAALDYNRLREALVSRAADAPLLLQALRWRLSRPARRQRRSALAQFIHNDLLHEDVLAAVLDPAAASPPLREQALRLVNLFASEAAGRSYLLTQSSLVPRLCAMLRLEPADTVSRQNALGALQKLSLRRAPQNAMIAADVISWLVSALATIDDLSQYSIEYGTALLMNLSLRTAGKAKCAAPQLDILSVLSQLMESDSMQVRTYVNGTLYSVLGRTTLKERAHEIGLPDSLRALIEHSDETLGRQINYILDQLESQPAGEDVVSEDEGDDEEEDAQGDDDEVEEEDDEPDLFMESALPTASTGGIAGEELLCSQYIAGVAEAQEEAEQLRATHAEASRRRTPPSAALESERAGPVRKRHSADEPLQRPSTPSARSMQQMPAAPHHRAKPGARARQAPAPKVDVEHTGIASEASTGDNGPEITAGSLEDGSVNEIKTFDRQTDLRPPPADPPYPELEPTDAPFVLRTKIPRTPQVKTRAELPSLQSAAAAPQSRKPQYPTRKPPRPPPPRS